ncbi:MAG: DUF1622 domain-containing protein [Pseudomonadota bacterium]
MEALDHWLEQVAHGVDLIGIAIVLYGFILATFGFVRSEVARLFAGGTMAGCMRVRIQLGTYILMGIEFMIASDIINTVLSRKVEDLIFVSALVVIRTAISFFLGRELKELEAAA